MKKEYVVSALGTERLAEAVIEAETPEEAKENYEGAWSNGEISAFDDEFRDWSIQEATCGDEEEQSSKKDDSKKTYLAKFSMRDGEHEYRAEFLVQAESFDEAQTIARSQEHEPLIPDEDDGELSCWDSGDGTTASRLQGVVEITDEEVSVLQRLGLVC